MILQPGDYVLFMNDMRTAHIEEVQPVAIAHTRKELEDFLAEERVEYYSDMNEDRTQLLFTEHRSNERWHKTFRKGGPLEWYNDVSHRIQQYKPKDICIPSVDELKNGTVEVESDYGFAEDDG